MPLAAGVSPQTLVLVGGALVGGGIAAVAGGGSGGTAAAATAADTPANTTPQKTPRLTIDPVTGDNHLSDGELAGGITVSGTATDIADGTVIAVSWGAARQTAIVEDGVWQAVFEAGSILATRDYANIYAMTGQTFAGAKVSIAALERPSLTIDAVSQDNQVTDAERSSGVTVSGVASNVEADSIVVVEWGTTTKSVTPSGTGRWSVTFSKDEIPQDTTDSTYTVRASIGDFATASREVMIAASEPTPEPLVARIAIDVVSGDDAVTYVERGSSITVAGTAENLADGVEVSVSWGQSTRQAVVENQRWSVVFARGEVPVQDAVIHAVAADGTQSPSTDSRAVSIAYPIVTASDLDLDIGGFAVMSPVTGQGIGSTVASAGDVNGDGLDDMLVGTASGTVAYIVFGNGTHAASGKAGTPGTPALEIRAETGSGSTLTALSAAGDVNADGLADILVGTAGSDRAYVVFGRATTSSVDLATVRYQLGGFVIEGETGEHVGLSVASAGDVDGDGFDDVIVSVSGGAHADRAYVVFGKSATQAVHLSDIADGNGGFAIEIPQDAGAAALSVSAGGDIDGDGLADILVGAPMASGQPGGGGAYVIYGSTSGAFTHTAVTQMGGATDDAMSDAGQPAVIAGGAGNDTISLSRGGSVALGGAGDDTLVIGIGFLLEGLAGAVDGRISHLDGGSGVDTLKIDGSGIVLDLTALQNPGMGLLHGVGRLSGIERVDLTGSGDNRLKISIDDIMDMSSANLFNSGNGWTGLAATENLHQMVVAGNAGDRVELASQTGWSHGGDATLDGVVYHIVTNASAGAALYIQDGVTGPLTI